MGIKKLTLSFENIVVRFCFLPRTLLFSICNQSVSYSVVVCVIDSEVLQEYDPSENVGVLRSNGAPAYVQWVRQVCHKEKWHHLILALLGSQCVQIPLSLSSFLNHAIGESYSTMQITTRNEHTE